MSTECTAAESLKVLAFEGWDAGSHRAVRESIERHGRHQWQWQTLPRGNWRWRLRLGAVDLVREAEAAGVLAQSWDVLFATSMVSLSDLAALLPPEIAARPRVLYMHENQAAYPSAAGRADPRDAHAAVTNLTSMLAADVVLWNSSWNRASFLEAMEAVLRARTDQADTGMLEEIRSKSSIAWPPVECPTASDPEVLHNASKARARGLTLVAWPHRWEHDKGPDELLRIEHEYGAEARIGWVLLGEQFDRQPPAFRQLLEHAGDRVLHAGTAARGVYETWLVACDWVVSTANHEFFGIAVTEALLAGCMPWLPERLSYPELVPAAFRGYSPMQPPDEPEAMIAAIRAHVSNARAETAVRRIEAAIPHRKDD